MLVTSARGIGEWGSVFGDPVVATATLDRIMHHSMVVRIRGDSYRLREKHWTGFDRPTPEAVGCRAVDVAAPVHEGMDGGEDRRGVQGGQLHPAGPCRAVVGYRLPCRRRA